MATASERIGKNESLFREVNERIREVSGAHFALGLHEVAEFVCECFSEQCHQPVQMTRAEYEQVRTDPSHFLVAPGHVANGEIEQTVAENERFWVVAKQDGARRVAVAEDPRN